MVGPVGMVPPLSFAGLNLNIYFLAGILEIILSLLLVGRISSFGLHRKGNREFIRLLYLFAGCGLATALCRMQAREAAAALLERWLVFPLFTSLPYFYLAFTAEFTEWPAWKKRRTRILFFAPYVACLAVNLFLPDILYHHFQETPSGFVPVYRPPVLVIALYTLLTSGILIGLLIRHAKNRPGDRKGIYIIVAGSIVGVVIAVAVSMVFPLVFHGLPDLIIFALLASSVSFYFAVIIDQKLFDIQKIISDFERLKYFDETSGALNVEMDFDALLKLFVNNARKASGARSVVYLRVADPGRFQLQAYSFDEKSIMPVLFRKLGKRGIRLFNLLNLRDYNIPFIRNIVDTRRHEVVGNLFDVLGELLPRMVCGALQLVSGVKAYAAFPIFAFTQVRGILLFSLARREDDLTLYHLFANQCGNILRHNELLTSYREARNEQAILLDNIATQIWYLRDPGTFGRVNKAFSAFYGLPPGQVEERPFEDTARRLGMPEQAIAASRNIFSEKRQIEIEEWVENALGEKRLLHMTFTPRLDPDGRVEYIVCVGSDITESRQIEEQLMQSQKMDAIGKLAGGIAHNFNNLMGGILGYADLMYEDPADAAKIRKFAVRISALGNHGSTLAQQLLTYARKNKYKVRPVNLHDIMGEVVNLVRNTFDPAIRVKSDYAIASPIVSGDATQLMQMVLNLALNARDAMPGGGVLTFSSRSAKVDQAFRADHPYAKPGRYVCLGISDTGKGIPAGDLPHIFEPFFTTKKMGKGMGLGLASVYGCVKNHGGFITVDSREGRGTTFQVYLPPAGAAPEAPASREKPAGTGKPPAFSGSVMVIEDEEDMRFITKTMLQKFGFSVAAFSGGREAVDHFKKAHDGMAAVITDLTLPDMDGLSCIRHIREINGKVPVIIMSGHSADGRPRELLKTDGAVFLQKPWTREHLRKALEQVLPK